MWANNISSNSNEIQRTELGTVDVGKYFQTVTESGKQISKCLVKNCGRRLEGNQIGNLETHMNVAHNMNYHFENKTYHRCQCVETPLIVC